MTDITERAQVGWGFWLRWVLASGVGIVVGIAVSLAMAAVGAVATLVVIGNTPDVDLSNPPNELLVLFGTIGFTSIWASVGIAQWLVLRWRQVPRASLWVLAITVSLAAHQLLPSGPVTTAFNLAGYGAITGGVMVWLLRQPATEEPSHSQEASSN